MSEVNSDGGKKKEKKRTDGSRPQSKVTQCPFINSSFTTCSVQSRIIVDIESVAIATCKF